MSKPSDVHEYNWGEFLDWTTDNHVDMSDNNRENWELLWRCWKAARGEEQI